MYRVTWTLFIPVRTEKTSKTAPSSKENKCNKRQRLESTSRLTLSSFVITHDYDATKINCHT